MVSVVACGNDPLGYLILFISYFFFFFFFFFFK